jgi:4-hydroxybenzoate polyprenyltransferase
MSRKTIFLTLRSARIILWPAIFFNAGLISFFYASASLRESILLASSLCLIASYGFLINDCRDVQVDRLNQANRLEYSTGSEIQFVWISSFLFLFIAFALSAALGIIGIASVAIIGFGLTVYTFYARKKLILATVLAATLSSTPLWLPNMIFHSQMTVSHICAISAAFLMLMGREILFDVGDHYGDSLGKRKTFATVFSQRFAFNLGALLNVFGAVALCIAVVFGNRHTPLSLLSTSILIFTLLTFSSITQFKDDLRSANKFAIFTRRSRLAMLLIPLFWLSI